MDFFKITRKQLKKNILHCKIFASVMRKRYWNLFYIYIANYLHLVFFRVFSFRYLKFCLIFYNHPSAEKQSLLIYFDFFVFNFGIKPESVRIS